MPSATSQHSRNRFSRSRHVALNAPGLKMKDRRGHNSHATTHQCGRSGNRSINCRLFHQRADDTEVLLSGGSSGHGDNFVSQSFLPQRQIPRYPVTPRMPPAAPLPLHALASLVIRHSGFVIFLFAPGCYVSTLRAPHEVPPLPRTSISTALSAGLSAMNSRRSMKSARRRVAPWKIWCDAPSTSASISC